jgi:hypothetical protein
MTQEQNHDTYIKRFLESPVYKTVTKKTIDTAFSAYIVAQWLSIISFCLGVVLILIAIVLGIFYHDRELLSILFGSIGGVEIVALLLYRPIERIQSGVTELIRAQIACLNFVAAYDSIARYLATASELPFDDNNRNLQDEFEKVKYLMEAANIFSNTMKFISIKDEADLQGKEFKQPKGNS